MTCGLNKAENENAVFLPSGRRRRDRAQGIAWRECKASSSYGDLLLFAWTVKGFTLLCSQGPRGLLGPRGSPGPPGTPVRTLAHLCTLRVSTATAL